MSEKVTITEIIRAVSKAPALSTAAMKIIELMSRRDHELGDIIDLIKYDSIITAKVLKVVNSPVYGLISPAETIERAVSFLGERMVLSICLEESIGEFLNKPLEGYECQKGELWRHDLRTAIASRIIARYANQESCNPELAFTGGLLHDIGKIIISDYLAGKSPEIIEYIEQQQVADFVGGEKAELGVNHAQIGYRLAKNWKLPESIQTIILYHHEPSTAPEDYRPLVYAVHLGDMLACMGGFVTGSNNLYYKLDQSYTDYLSFDTQQMEMAMLETDEEFMKIVQAMKGTAS